VRLAPLPEGAPRLAGAPAAPGELDLSVAICTRNRRAEVERALESLALQEWSGRWEVLVVDNASSDDTRAAALARAAHFTADLRVVNEPEQGLSYARNRALVEARGDVVVFVDDDVTFEPGWLAAHGDTYADPEVLGTGGRILPVMPAGAPAWWQAVLPDEIGGPTSRYDFGDEPGPIGRDGSLPPPFGANMGVRRAAALEVGAFHTGLGWGRRMIPSEDLEFFRRVFHLPGRVVYVPNATVRHHIEASRTTRDYYLRWNRGYGRALVRMDPPRGFGRRRRRLRDAWREARRWSRERVARRRAGDEVAELDALRERERARGRLLELLGL
jgi:glycosyltransferase involved in cell wall biosynthesis